MMNFRLFEKQISLKNVLLFVFVFLSTSCDPIENLYKVIRKNGYIVFHTPLQYAGTGTLLSGTPKRLSLIAPPQTCFPDQVNGEPTFLRFLDATSLPTRDYYTSMSFTLALEYMKHMPVDKPDKPPVFIEIPGIGPLPIELPQTRSEFHSQQDQNESLSNMPFPIDKLIGRSEIGQVTSSDPEESKPPQTIDLGFQYQKVKKVFMSFEGAEVEYLDMIHLNRFYKNHMSSECKTYLEQVGFITQALKVNKLKFSFQGESSGLIDLSLMNLNEIIQLDPRLEWKIIKNVYLEFESPRYIGYQLGRLVRDELGGLTLLRATEAKGEHYKYQSVGHFFDSSKE